jgi:sec-independent protein translocase protein TatB
MFDFDAGKLIVIGIVALIAIPSKDLPRVLRTLGQFTGRMRRMAAEFQGQLSEALREAELSDLKKEFDETNRKIMETTGAFDPMTQVRKEMTRVIEAPPARRAAASSEGAGGAEGPHSDESVGVSTSHSDAPSGVSKPHPEEPRSGVSKDAPDEKAAS